MNCKETKADGTLDLNAFLKAGGDTICGLHLPKEVEADLLQQMFTYAGKRAVYDTVMLQANTSAPQAMVNEAEEMQLNMVWGIGTFIALNDGIDACEYFHQEGHAYRLLKDIELATTGELLFEKGSILYGYIEDGGLRPFALLDGGETSLFWYDSAWDRLCDANGTLIADSDIIMFK